jgi:hypothetical protein
MMWQNITETIKKKINLSNPNSAEAKGFFGFNTLMALKSLVSLSNLESLPILVSLTKEFNPLAYKDMILSNGKIATASMGNHPSIYLLAIFDLLLTITKSSSTYIVLKQTVISTKKNKSQIILKVSQWFELPSSILEKWLCSSKKAKCRGVDKQVTTKRIVMNMSQHFSTLDSGSISNLV